MKKESGQALLELSILGSLFLVFLAALISYGLKFNYQQHVMQRTFRKALYYSNHKKHDKGNVNYLSIEDRHVPDPLDT
ncbi:MAG: pilus assembly protein, partial [Candidatus Omnitrophica bacterium]|nr:pilus assembly protein [Candidatus Omnitrophota bacterium]